MSIVMIVIFIYLCIGMLGMMWMMSDDEVKEELNEEDDRGYFIIALGVLLWPWLMIETFFGDE